MALRTPLYDLHVAAGARMVPFGGWDMPVQYASALNEHHAVRRSDTHIGLPETREYLERDGPGVVGIEQDRRDEVAESGDERERRACHQAGPEQRKGHPPETPPAAGTERGGGISERRVQPPHAGEQRPAGYGQVADGVRDRQ